MILLNQGRADGLYQFGVREFRFQLRLTRMQCDSRPYLGGDVSEVTDHAEAAVRQDHAVDAPFIVVGHCTIEALLDALRHDVGFSRVERMAEEAHDLVRAVLLPETMDHLA